MKELIRKLSSRKLWMAIAGVTSGIAIALGVDGGNITTISGAVMAIFSVVTYIVTEGKVDAESVKNAVEKTESAIDLLGEQEEQK